MVTVQPSGHLLPVLDFSQVTFTHVIIKRNTEVMQEQKVVILIIPVWKKRINFYSCLKNQYHQNNGTIQEFL